MHYAQKRLQKNVLHSNVRTENGFKVGTYQELIPTADLVINLTPDKQHSKVVADVMPLMKKILHSVTHTVSTSLKWVSKSVKTSL